MSTAPRATEGVDSYEQRVTPLELFFDLVFVFALTQVTGFLSSHLTWVGMLQAAAQGLGMGTRLLEPVLSLADAAGQPCYLETQTERNVAWYRKLGFEVRDSEVSFTPGGPPNWTMVWHPGQR
jgi:hypothetical protein